MLRCAYLPTTAPQVLVWGSAGDMLGFGAFLAALATSPREEMIGDEQSPDRIFLSFSHAPLGMHITANTLSWQIAPSDASRFAELIEAMTLDPGPCHQYLDCASGSGIQVKASIGEYPEDFLP